MYVLREEQGGQRVPRVTQHASAGHQTIPGPKGEDLEERGSRRGVVVAVGGTWRVTSFCHTQMGSTACQR